MHELLQNFKSAIENRQKKVGDRERAEEDLRLERAPIVSWLLSSDAERAKKEKALERARLEERAAEEALNDVVEELSAYVCRMVNRETRSPKWRREREELYQIALCLLYEKIGKYASKTRGDVDLDRDAIACGWCATVVRNAVYSYFRRAGRRAEAGWFHADELEVNDFAASPEVAAIDYERDLDDVAPLYLAALERGEKKSREFKELQISYVYSVRAFVKRRVPDEGKKFETIFHETLKLVNAKLRNRRGSVPSVWIGEIVEDVVKKN
ncbi:MAG: sigma-70 family RNA polymerase sigma factor [Thermoguttaceae bacterium]|nr:sigma-70 family RNA polymerase sigma factor [Thermoguttaceae bacterium]